MVASSNHSTKPRVVVLTGAGISADSGIATFRDADGLWEKHRIEDVATPEAFQRDPELVHNFYNQRRQGLLDPSVKPNAGHYALVQLEEYLQDRFLLVTQNIDNLHERAGSKRVLHMHGELLKMRAAADGSILAWNQPATPESLAAVGHTFSSLRPDIVWFGEMPFFMDEIYEALERCEVFISVGSSGSVYPAAGFVQVARQAGAQCYEINLEAGDVHTLFQHHIYGRASEVLPPFVQQFRHDWKLLQLNN